MLIRHGQSTLACARTSAERPSAAFALWWVAWRSIQQDHFEIYFGRLRYRVNRLVLLVFFLASLIAFVVFMLLAC